MKESIRKTIGYLGRYVGHKVIRTRPIVKGRLRDCTFMTEPVLLTGFTEDGRITYRNVKEYDKQEERTLPVEYTDRNWITYKKALRTRGSKMRHLIGEKIRWINPNADQRESSLGNRAEVTLISASKYHIVVSCNGKKRILAGCYTDPNNWVKSDEIKFPW